MRVKHDMFYDYGPALSLSFSLLSSIDAISMFTLALALSIATSICRCIQHERELNMLSSVYGSSVYFYIYALPVEPYRLSKFSSGFLLK